MVYTSQKSENRSPGRPRHFTPGNLLKKMKSGNKKVVHTLMSMAAQFTIVEVQNQSKCPSTDDTLEKLLCRYTMSHYSSKKALHLVKQPSPKNTNVMFPLACVNYIDYKRYNIHGWNWHFEI